MQKEVQVAAEKPDAVALLQADHRKVEELFAKFKEGEAEENEKIVLEICTELSIHAMLEEEIFYPACQKAMDDGELVSEAYVEHDGAKVLIAELIDSEADNAFYDAKVMVLSEMIKRHVAEEEKNLFPQAKKAGLDLAAIGAKLLARKEELVAKFAGGNLPPPETRSFTGHKLVQAAPLAAD
jgi:hemerythrin superfamily protein